MLRVILFFLLIILFMGKIFSQASGWNSSANIMFKAALNGTQEIPSVDTKAVGSAWAVLSDDNTTLYYQVTYTQLSSEFITSNFQLGLPGVNGGFIREVQFNGNTASGSWSNLPDSIIGALVGGQIYINVQSIKNPGGELRGQFSLVNGPGFTISLNANQTGLSSDTSKATGTGWAFLYNNGSTLSYNITLDGLTSPIIFEHFHYGSPGINSGVAYDISNPGNSNTGNSIIGSWTGLNRSDLDSLIRNDIYVNIHTVIYQNGEIRGQVLKVGLIGFHASLNGNQELPSVTTEGSGTGWFLLDSRLSSLTYQVTYAQLSSSFQGAYFQQGSPGAGGNIIELLTPYIGNTFAGIWTDLPDSIIISMINGNFYLNINSSSNPHGEISGELLLNNSIGFSVNLNSAQDVSKVISSASGTAWLVYSDDTLKFQITFAGLSSQYYQSHFHDGVPGENGPLVDVLTFTDSTLNSYWTGINDTTISDLVNGKIYIDIHSNDYKIGELRGQVILMSPESIITGINNNPGTIPALFLLSQNYPNPFNPSTVISWQLSLRSIVKLKLYDILGREITTLFNGFQNAGPHFLLFNAQQIANHRQLSSGVYYYRLEAGGYSATKKMMYLK
jgi:hypothetical protein